jgi:hypothetical protein
LSHVRSRPRLVAPALLGAALLALALIVTPLGSAAEPKAGAKPKPTAVKVMTRNIYLGADLTPAIQAKGVGAFVEATGEILRQVTANDFPVRAKGLAREILKKGPDLVGLQEVAEWRSGPPSLEAARGNGPLRLPRRTAGAAEQGQEALPRRGCGAGVRLRSARRRERRPR